MAEMAIIKESSAIKSRTVRVKLHGVQCAQSREYEVFFIYAVLCFMEAALERECSETRLLVWFYYLKIIIFLL